MSAWPQQLEDQKHQPKCHCVLCCCAQVIVYLLGRATVPAADAGERQQEAAEGEDMALTHLRTVAALVEQYFHPSNNGR